MNGKREKSPLANKMKEIRAILIKHNGKKIKKNKKKSYWGYISIKRKAERRFEMSNFVCAQNGWIILKCWTRNLLRSILNLIIL